MSFYRRTGRATNAQRAARAELDRRWKEWFALVLAQSKREEIDTLALSAILGEGRLSVETVNAIYCQSSNVEARRRIYACKRNYIATHAR